jgi:hypothetical protein
MTQESRMEDRLQSDRLRVGSPESTSRVDLVERDGLVVTKGSQTAIDGWFWRN